MSLKIVCFSLYLLVLAHCILLLHLAVAKPNGFTMKLIHRDSTESPLYPGNLTAIERLRRMRNQTKHRMHQISLLTKRNTTAVKEPNAAVRPKVYWDYNNALYLALVCMGNTREGPGTQMSCHNYYLAADTGSNDIWTQCEGCRSCFNQRFPLFPYSRSETYHPLLCNQHPLCTPGDCWGDYCSYSINYADESSTAGVLATEQFRFNSDTTTPEVINDLVFGCGTDQKDWEVVEDNKMSGILGLGTGPRSLLTQLGHRANGILSYCLQDKMTNEDRSTFLQFGDDANFPAGANVQTTPYKTTEELKIYYVNLLDISVGNRKLNFPPGNFDVKEDGTGGCIIDIGTAITSMHKRDYAVVRAAVVEYFSTTELKIIQNDDYDLCFQGNYKDIPFPEITLHFQNADLVVEEYAYVLIGMDSFCFGLDPEDVEDIPMLLGNNFQVNYRFLYNTNDLTISFAKEECNPVN